MRQSALPLTLIYASVQFPAVTVDSTESSLSASRQLAYIAAQFVRHAMLTAATLGGTLAGAAGVSLGLAFAALACARLGADAAGGEVGGSPLVTWSFPFPLATVSAMALFVVPRSMP